MKSSVHSTLSCHLLSADHAIIIELLAGTEALDLMCVSGVGKAFLDRLYRSQNPSKMLVSGLDSRVVGGTIRPTFTGIASANIKPMSTCSFRYLPFAAQ